MFYANYRHWLTASSHSDGWRCHTMNSEWGEVMQRSNRSAWIAAVVTFVTVICLMTWPLTTAAVVLAGSGVWAAVRP